MNSPRKLTLKLMSMANVLTRLDYTFHLPKPIWKSSRSEGCQRRKVGTLSRPPEYTLQLDIIDVRY